MAQGARILVVDDEVAARTALAEILRDEGYVADTAGDGFKALARIEESRPDLISTDLRMPSMDGFELVRRLRRADIDVPVVVMTAFGAVDTAIIAMREGAVDFVVKPLDTNQLLMVVERALAARGNRPSPDQSDEAPAQLTGLVCLSQEMQSVARTVRQAAPTRAGVLLVGETGSGRERIARGIHALSKRANGPFVTVSSDEVAARHVSDGASLPDELAQLFAQAQHGTLYVHDIHLLPLIGQVALYDLLTSSPGETGAEVRVLSSTDRDLKSLAAVGAFDERLCWRLAVVRIDVPPLRERRADLMALTRELLAENGAGSVKIAPDAVARLEGHVWPGNVDELRGTLHAALMRTNGGTLTARDIELAPTAQVTPPPVIPGSTLSEIERYAILMTLDAHGGSTSRAARVLGISVRKIQYKLHEYGAARPRPDDPSAEQS